MCARRTRMIRIPVLVKGFQTREEQRAAPRIRILHIAIDHTYFMDWAQLKLNSCPFMVSPDGEFPGDSAGLSGWTNRDIRTQDIRTELTQTGSNVSGVNQLLVGGPLQRRCAGYTRKQDGELNGGDSHVALRYSYLEF